MWEGQQSIYDMVCVYPRISCADPFVILTHEKRSLQTKHEDKEEAGRHSTGSVLGIERSLSFAAVITRCALLPL